MNEGDRLRSVFGGVRSIIFLLLRQLYLSYFLMFQLLSSHILFTSFVLSSSSFCVLSHTKIIIGNRYHQLPSQRLTGRLHHVQSKQNLLCPVYSHFWLLSAWLQTLSIYRNNNIKQQ